MLPEVLDLRLLEAFRGEGKDTLFEDGVGDHLAGAVTVIEEELEDGVAVCEGRLRHVFKFNDELVLHVEGLERVAPVVDV